MLAYVSVTRAKLILDRGGLAWIDNYATGELNPEQESPARPPVNRLLSPSPGCRR
jgi:hypothetical protein